MKKYKVPRNKHADHVVNFIQCLKHTKDYSGKPFKLAKFQEDFVRQLFGTLDKKNNRVFERAFLFLPTGSGKTELIAAIALYCLFTFPPGQEIISCASTKKQASLILEAAKQMVRMNPVLSKRCRILKERIAIEEKFSYYTSICSSPENEDGVTPSVCLIDEYHCQRNHALISMLEAKLAKRNNPMWIGISTAGIYSQERPCYQEYQLAKKIASGEVENPNFLPVIYEADPESDWTDEKTWIACNPALQAGFKNIEAMRKSCKLAQEIPSRESFWRQQHLNQWSNQSSQWLSMDAWDESNIPFDVEELKGRECFAGMDLAPVRDLSSLCLLFPFDDGTYKVLSFNWCNEEEIRQRSKDYPYNVWENQGFLRSTPGNATDFEFIRRDINELAKIYNIKVIATDPHQCHQLAQELQEQDGLNVQWFRQGFVSQAEPTFKLEKLVIEEKLHHNGNPVLRWAAGNVVTVSDEAGNIKISKKKSTEKVDPIAALVNAIGIEMMDTEEQPSVYETEGIFYV